jgi:hypothetical protein
MASKGYQLLYFSRSTSKRNLLFTCLVIIVLSTYVASYCALLRARTPAGNLGYFVFECPPAADAILYYTFYPLYKLHEWSGLPRFIPHSRDRPEIVQPYGDEGR